MGVEWKSNLSVWFLKKKKKKKPKRMSKINQSDYISLRNVINIVSSTTRIIKATEIWWKTDNSEKLLTAMLHPRNWND